MQPQTSPSRPAHDPRIAELIAQIHQDEKNSYWLNDFSLTPLPDGKWQLVDDHGTVVSGKMTLSADRQAKEILAKQYVGDLEARRKVDHDLQALERALGPTPWTFLKETRPRWPRE